MGILSFNRKQIHRLSTHEDANFGHLHKVIGFVSLGHYGYRWWRWSQQGDMGFDNTWTTLAWILFHMSLHVTSFQFHLSAKRNRVYNVIWPEMRWHTMIFAYRSFVTMLALWLANGGGASLLHFDPDLVRPHLSLIRPLIILATMVFADLATHYYGSAENTMRGNPYPAGTPSVVSGALNYFYSISQAAATLRLLGTSSVEGAFVVALPIQLAPFLMTLVKKGLITQGGWHFWYTASLLTGYVHSILTVTAPPHLFDWERMVAYLMVFAFSRFVLRVNKYVIWTTYSIVAWNLAQTSNF